MKRYGIVLAGALLVALVLGALARAPRTAPVQTDAHATLQVDSLKVTFADGTARPEAASVPVGHRLALTFANEGPRSITAGLAGYEDRVPPARLAPGAARTVTFVADRPGEAFAFLVDGEPCGRLAVTGSHLPEGHR